MIRHFPDLELGQITATYVDSSYLWIGYLLSGVARLRKVSISDPTSVYFDIEINATQINKMHIGTETGYIVLALSSEDYLGARVNKSNPTSIVYYNKPGTVSDNAIDVIEKSNYTYLLTPGVTQSKLVKYYYGTTTYNTIKEINLDGDIIVNAKAMTSDGTNLWIVTYTDPMKLIKVKISDLTIEQITTFAS